MAAPAAEVLTLNEAAGYLRVSPETLAEHASRGAVPGQQIGSEWRFLRPALTAWLARGNDQARLLQLVGALADDEHLAEITADAYRQRGRPEVDPQSAE